MRKILIFLSTMMMGCCPCRHLATTAQDSVRVEVVERVEYITDTIKMAIPYEREEVVRDTTSHLENDYAKSDAAILPNGRLLHTLETRPQLKPFSIQVPRVRRDSIIHHNTYREVKVEVKGELTKLQQFQISGFWLMLILFSILIFIRWVGRR